MVPKSVTSTMFSWPMELASRASCSSRATKSLFAEELLQQHLHGDALADHRVLGLVDGAHPALADAADDLIAVGEHSADERIEARFLLGRGRGRRDRRRRGRSQMQRRRDGDGVGSPGTVGGHDQAGLCGGARGRQRGAVPRAHVGPGGVKVLWTGTGQSRPPAADSPSPSNIVGQCPEPKRGVHLRPRRHPGRHHARRTSLPGPRSRGGTGFDFPGGALLRARRRADGEDRRDAARRGGADARPGRDRAREGADVLRQPRRAPAASSRSRPCSRSRAGAAPRGPLAIASGSVRRLVTRTLEHARRSPTGSPSSSPPRTPPATSPSPTSSWRRPAASASSPRAAPSTRTPTSASKPPAAPA